MCRGGHLKGILVHDCYFLRPWSKAGCPWREQCSISQNASVFTAKMIGEGKAGSVVMVLMCLTILLAGQQLGHQWFDLRIIFWHPKASLVFSHMGSLGGLPCFSLSRAGRHPEWPGGGQNGLWTWLHLLWIYVCFCPAPISQQARKICDCLARESPLFHCKS